MKRRTTTGLMLLILMSLALSTARAETVAAQILLGKRELACSPAAAYDGKRVLVPLSVLEQLGVVCSPAPKSGTVTLTSAGGRTGEAGLVDVGGQKMLPLDALLGITGGEAAWDADQKTAAIHAHLQSVEFVDGTLKVNCSFPVNCTARKWQNKLIVDVADAKIASEAKEVYVGGPIVSRARLGQYNPDTARVVLDLTQDAGITLESRLPAAQLVFLVGQNLPKPGVQPPQPAATPTPAKPPAAKPPTKQPYTVDGIRLETVDDGRFNLVVETSAKALIAPAFGVCPPEIELTLIGATLSDAAKEFEGAHSLLKSLKVAQVSGGKPGVKVNMSLARIATYEASVAENAVTLSIYLPEKAGGTLDGMTVVIDPGHGGREKGARWETTYEKELTVRIANALKAALEEEGVKTILTRDGDQVMGLAARSEVAINDAADFFMSVHCNSNGSAESVTGIETYYHMEEPSARALGYAIQAAVCSATGMCDGRARSDRSLYSSGLGVLRRLEGSGVPGILLECGYLNNSADRKKLLDAEYRKKLAAGIVAGLKAYVEGAEIK